MAGSRHWRRQSQGGGRSGDCFLASLSDVGESGPTDRRAARDHLAGAQGRPYRRHDDRRIGRLLHHQGRRREVHSRCAASCRRRPPHAGLSHQRQTGLAANGNAAAAVGRFQQLARAGQLRRALCARRLGPVDRHWFDHLRHDPDGRRRAGDDRQDGSESDGQRRVGLFGRAAQSGAAPSLRWCRGGGASARWRRSCSPRCGTPI